MVVTEVDARQHEAEPFRWAGGENAAQLAEHRTANDTQSGDNEQPIDLAAETHRIADCEQRRGVYEYDVRTIPELRKYLDDNV